MQVRPAREDDSPRIAALVADYAREKNSPIDAASVAAAVDACVGDPTRTVLVAESDGKVLGYVAAHWIPFPMIGGVECYISDLIVSASERGAGVGRQLIEHLEGVAREMGCKRLMLNNRMASESYKRKFYPKLGFQVREDFANLVKPLK